MTLSLQMSAPTSAMHWANGIQNDYAHHAIMRHCERVQRDQLHNDPDNVAAPLILTPPGQYHMLQPHVPIVQNPGCCSCEPAYTDQEWQQIIHKARIEQLAAAGHPVPGADYQPPRRRQQPMLPTNDIALPQFMPAFVLQDMPKQHTVSSKIDSKPMVGVQGHGVVSAMSDSSRTHPGDADLPGAVPQCPPPSQKESKQPMANTAKMAQQRVVCPTPQPPIPTVADSVSSERTAAVLPANDKPSQGPEQQVPKRSQPHAQNRPADTHTSNSRSSAVSPPVHQTMTTAESTTAGEAQSQPHQIPAITDMPMPDKPTTADIYSHHHQQQSQQQHQVGANQAPPTSPAPQVPQQVHPSAMQLVSNTNQPATQLPPTSQPTDAQPLLNSHSHVPQSSPNPNPSVQQPKPPPNAAGQNGSTGHAPQVRQQQEHQLPPPAPVMPITSANTQVQTAGAINNAQPQQQQQQQQQQAQGSQGQQQQQQQQLQLQQQPQGGQGQPQAVARQHAAPIRDSAAEMPTHPQAAGSDMQASSRQASTAGQAGQTR